MSLPLPTLRARLLAWPYVSARAFESGALRLPSPSPSSRREPPDLPLDAIDDVRVQAGGTSLEQLIGWRDLAWAQLQAPAPIRRIGEPDLLDGLQHLAAQRLAHDGLALRVNPSTSDPVEAPNPVQQALDWYALAGELPTALLHHAHPRGCAPAGPALGLEEPIRELLARGVTEQHSHLGSARTFESVWEALLTRMPNPSLAITTSERRPLDHLAGAHVLEVWGAAAVTRALLQRLLSGQVSSATICDLHPKALRALTHEPLTLRQTLRWVLRRPRQRPVPPPPLAALRARLGRLLRDPWTEDRLQRALWEQLPSADDPFLRRLALQYLRLYAWSWRWVTLPQGIGGLDWFKESYRRVGALGDQVEDRAIRVALHGEECAVRLLSAEWRVMPPKPGQRDRGLIPYVRESIELQIARRAQRHPETELGFVVHFPKPEPKDERTRARGLNHGKWIADQMRLADGVRGALARHPELLVYLRGLDVCNRELALPLWPTLLPLDACLRAGRAAAQVLQRRRSHWGTIPPLRMTYHIGEECRHLQDGLRRMAELVDFGLLQMGDRVGHGLALARDPVEWCERWPSVNLPQGERLDDLTWEWERYARRELEPQQRRMIWLEAEIRRLAANVYGRDDLDPSRVVAARRQRHHRPLLRTLWRGLEPPNTDADRLAAMWIRLASLDARRATAIEVKRHDTDLPALQALQRHVRGQYERHHITVEANPTSNLVIGELRDIRHHPMFHLSPLAGATGQVVPVSVNCDNLLVGDTNLANEYNRLWMSLLDRGVASAEALSWLDRAREAGLRARFTLPQSHHPRVLSWFIANFEPHRRNRTSP